MNNQALQQQLGYGAMVGQNFRALDRGDMFVPGGRVTAPTRQASMATPMLGIMNVHAVPVSYSQAKARTVGTVGMITPTVSLGVNSSGY